MQDLVVGGVGSKRVVVEGEAVGGGKGGKGGVNAGAKRRVQKSEEEEGMDESERCLKGRPPS